MGKLDLLTVGGLIAGLALIFGAIALGGAIDGYWDTASVLITVLGSFAALIMSYDKDKIKSALAMVKIAFFVKEDKMGSLIETFIALSAKARREGLLALEEEMESLNDPFFEKGLQMVVDGMEPELINDIMETELHHIEERHQDGQGLFKTWANYAPAFGMMGTLIGLVQMLRDLNDPSKIGPAMAIALLTTFYGVLMANLILLPIANKLGVNSKQEILEKQIIIEGILAIQSGINPRIIEEKLKIYLPPKFRQGIKEENEAEELGRGVTLDAS